jgi:hypothetical protein
VTDLREVELTSVDLSGGEAPHPAKTIKTWRCQKQTGGVKCRHDNPKRFEICQKCGKKRKPFKRQAHFSLLDLPYEAFVLVNGEFGERCGICGAPPVNKRNDRDHEHSARGLVRGILCHRCNRVLGKRMEAAVRQMGMTLPEWLRAAADYVERAEEWRGINLEALL